jgi:hypothetical protein
LKSSVTIHSTFHALLTVILPVTLKDNVCIKTLAYYNKIGGTGYLKLK